MGVRHKFSYFCSKSFCVNAATMFCEECQCCFCAGCNERQHNHAKRFNHKLYDLNVTNIFEILKDPRLLSIFRLMFVIQIRFIKPD